MAALTDNLTLYRYKRTNKAYVEDLGDGISLMLMLIPGGEFMMGASDSELESRDNERPQHRVTVAPFLIGRYPVTQSQWRVVAGSDRQDKYIKRELFFRFRGDDLPVEKVSWHDAIEFCQRLSTKTQKNYHLPSEAQWEYACRAETTMAYHFGDQLTDEVANCGSKVSRTTPVGQYPANRWGLHDMHGNVSEWCQDDWHDSYEDAPNDGSAWLKGGDSTYRVRRGGSWFDAPSNSRSAYRVNHGPGRNNAYLGFRVVCSAPRTL